MSRTISFVISYTIWLVGITVAVHFFGLQSVMISMAAVIIAKLEMLENTDTKEEEKN